MLVHGESHIVIVDRSSGNKNRNSEHTMNLEHVANIHGFIVKVHRQNSDGSVVIGGDDPAFQMRYVWKDKKLIYRDKQTGRIASREVER